MQSIQRLARSLAASLVVASIGVGLAACHKDERRLVILGEGAVSTFPPATGEPLEGGSVGILAFVNAERLRAGVPSLEESNELGAFASDYAAEMYATGRLSHVDSDGRSPFGRLRFAGIPYEAAGETIGLGRSTGEVLRGFLQSRAHREILLAARFCEIGSGVVGGPSGDLIVVLVRRWREPVPVGSGEVTVPEPTCGAEPGPGGLDERLAIVDAVSLWSSTVCAQATRSRSLAGPHELSTVRACAALDT